MDYCVVPPVRKLDYLSGECLLTDLQGAFCCASAEESFFSKLSPSLQPKCIQDNGYYYYVGERLSLEAVAQPQGYRLSIRSGGIALQATDEAGLRYGMDTFVQLVSQAQNGALRCLDIVDYPSVLNRGLMLDVSRGKVYTRKYLLNLIDLLGRLRYNVFQLYIEHTFDFKNHPEICVGSDPITAEDILAIQQRCKENGIEFQANLQSLGHCNRILTRKEYRHMAESDMYWSLCTTSDAVLELLDSLYSEYLPLFESEWLNICLDEPYDIGRGQSADTGKEGAELYVDYLLKLHALAAQYGKRLMLFGDVFTRHPEYLSRMPKDMVYLDWCYDPKETYHTPSLFAQNGMPFWVCPGSGNWNTLFPRVDGAITNVENLTLEGIAAGTQGMLFCDWNDHGGYTQPGHGYYMYAHAAVVGWLGCIASHSVVDVCADYALSQPGYSAVIHGLADIYQIPPLWSKNRSECVMALFDEPIFGNAVRGPHPPASLKAYDLALPEGIEPVFERHSQHPLRPYFCIPESVCEAIRNILEKERLQVAGLKDNEIKGQLTYTLDSFELMLDKLALSRAIIAAFEGGNVTQTDLLDFEDALRLMVRRYILLQLKYTDVWFSVAKTSEIDISLTYFAHIVERLDYLRNWLSIQRERLSNGEDIDLCFASYETAGYGTLPTY